MSLLLRNRGALLLLMINIFIVFTGIGLVVPIMPTYMNELHIAGALLVCWLRPSHSLSSSARLLRVDYLTHSAAKKLL